MYHFDMIPPRPSKDLPPPRKANVIRISPNMVWDCVDEIHAYVLRAEPGAKLISVREVKRYECTLELPLDRVGKLPDMCHDTRLYSFPDEKAMDKFKVKFHPGLPILAKWKCKFCQGWHQWATASTDTNGGSSAGAFTVGAYLRRLMNKTAVEGSIKTYER